MLACGFPGACPVQGLAEQHATRVQMTTSGPALPSLPCLPAPALDLPSQQLMSPFPVTETGNKALQPMCRKLVLGSNPDEFAFSWPGSLGWRAAMTASCGLFESDASEQKIGSKSVPQGFQAALRVPSLPAPEFSQDARRGATRGLLHHLNSVLITLLGFLMSACPRSLYSFMNMCVCTCSCGECTCVYRWGMVGYVVCVYVCGLEKTSCCFSGLALTK